MTGKKVAIVQSNYVPWKGYFDLIHLVDEFILLDDVQYTKRDWRNRNRLKTPQGAQWLTIPVETKGRYLQKIKDTTIGDAGWAQRHWKAIACNYASARYFPTYRERLEDLYRVCHERRLSQVNHRFLVALCEMLGIKTKIAWSMDYQPPEGSTERLVWLCQQAGATGYLSGPAAKAYLDEERFSRAGIAVEYMDYTGYPEYTQLFPPFDHHVSVLDLLLNEGPAAPKFMKSF